MTRLRLLLQFALFCLWGLLGLLYSLIFGDVRAFLHGLDKHHDDAVIEIKKLIQIQYKAMADADALWVEIDAMSGEIDAITTHPHLFTDSYRDRKNGDYDLAVKEHDALVAQVRCLSVEIKDSPFHSVLWPVRLVEAAIHRPFGR